MCCVIVSLRGFWNVGSRLLSEPLNSIRLDVSLVDPMVFIGLLIPRLLIPSLTTSDFISRLNVGPVDSGGLHPSQRHGDTVMTSGPISWLDFKELQWNLDSMNGV